MTDPRGLVARLDRHPMISAPPGVALGNVLHGAARHALAEDGRGRHAGEDLLTLAQSQGGAALASCFSAIRRTTGAPVVVLFDAEGPLFPFLDPPDVEVLALTRTPEAVAVALGAGGIQRVIDAARQAVEAFDRRIDGMGVPASRIQTVDEDHLKDRPHVAWPALCRRLGVADDASALGDMIAPVADPWSTRGTAI